MSNESEHTNYRDLGAEGIREVVWASNGEITSLQKKAIAAGIAQAVVDREIPGYLLRLLNVACETEDSLRGRL